jgi:cyanophycinase
MTVPRSSIVLLLAGIWFLSITARADEGPKRFAASEDVPPEGISGSLLLCGPGCPSEVILSALERRGRLGSVVIASVGSGGLTLDIDRLDALGADDVRAVHAEHGADLMRAAPDVWNRACDVLWLHCDTASSREVAETRELWEALQRIQASRGTIVASGATATALLEAAQRQGDASMNGVFELLPGCQWCDPSRETSRRTPENGRVGVRWDDTAVLSVRGRQLATPRTSAGTVTLTLQASASRSARTIDMRPGSSQDLTALRRAAAARAGKAWPPVPCDAPRVERGTLFIVGGGTLTDALVSRFVELAGGREARIVVVPTAAEPDGVSERREVGQFREAGAGHVELLHARDREESGTEEFLRPLREATAVWFTGGRQWRLVDRYEGTPFVGACRELLARGGVIGGSSAGATIQGDYLVRGSPLGNEEMMAEGYERGFAFLPGTAIDQHFTQRSRGPDMVMLKQTFPQWLGIGIDESTALEVRGDRATVLGNGAAAFYDRPAGEDVGASTVVFAGGAYNFTQRAAMPAP